MNRLDIRARINIEIAKVDRRLDLTEAEERLLHDDDCARMLPAPVPRG